MDQSSIGVETSVDMPPMTDNNMAVEVLEPEEGWFFPADPDVKLATQVTFAIAVILILKVLYDIWQKRRRQMRFGTEGTEEFERHKASTRNRIDIALKERVHECPICLCEANYPVLTDCGHVFCCTCIIQYWQQSKSIVYACDCAMCRCPFYMLLPVKWPSPGASEEIDDQLHENNMRLDDYNRRFSIERPALDFIRDIPVLIPYLVRNFFNNDIFAVVNQIRIALVIIFLAAYFCLPNDLFPESMYGLVGFMDDCLIGILVICGLINWFRNYMAERGQAHRQR